MSIDMMKSNGTRCPPILIGGLIIMCIYLVCSWWSLTSQNAELLKQIDNLAEQLRINGDELDKCSQQKNLLDEKLKDSQKQFLQKQVESDRLKDVEKQMKSNYERLMADADVQSKQIMGCERNMKLCRAEMESLKKLGQSKDKTSQTLRTENESLKSEIVQKEKQIEELENKLKNLNRTGDFPARNKFMQSLVEDYHSKMKKNQLENEVGNKTNKETQDAEEQKYEKAEGEAKNYGDSGLLPMDNDPREAEMKGT